MRKSCRKCKRWGYRYAYCDDKQEAPSGGCYPRIDFVSVVGPDSQYPEVQISRRCRTRGATMGAMGWTLVSLPLRVYVVRRGVEQAFFRPPREPPRIYLFPTCATQKIARDKETKSLVQWVTAYTDTRRWAASLLSHHATSSV